MKKQSYTSHGFALLEVFIAMLIITTLIFGLIIPGLTLNNYQKRKTTHNRIQHIQNAINNYVITYGRLPCPINVTNNSAQNYQEQLSNGVCSSVSSFNSGNTLYGAVPVDTLNISREYAQDGWGNKIMYIVPKDLTPSITSKRSIVFYKNTSLGYKIAQTQVSTNTLTYTQAVDFSNYLNTYYRDSGIDRLLTNNNIYLLLSYGDNALGAYTIDGVQNSTVGYNTTVGEENNFVSTSKNNNNFFTNPSKNLRGGKLDDIVYEASLNDIISENTSLIHCDYRYSPYYALESRTFSSPIAANSTGAPNFIGVQYYTSGSMIQFDQNCATCPTVSGRRLYVECQNGNWGEIIKRDCTC